MSRPRERSLRRRPRRRPSESCCGPRLSTTQGSSCGRSRPPDGPAFRVVGERPTRWVRQTDFTNDEAVGYLADRLGRLGVEEALLAAGAVAGDTVLIGPEDDAVVFDWQPTLVSGAELLGERGTDLRLDERTRLTRDEKREAAHDRYLARQSTQAELEAERRAGHWATAAAAEDIQDAEVVGNTENLEGLEGAKDAE